MDYHAAILASLPGLKDRLRRAGVGKWLKEQPGVVVEGQRYVVLGGDRLASRNEAMLAFAVERGLVNSEEVQRAASGLPLPSDVEAMEIDPEKQGDS